jgi:hypothetical protein
MPINLLSAGGGTTTLTTASSGSNFTVTIPAATGSVITTAPGTSGNVLTSNGTIWTSAAAGGFGVGQTWTDVIGSRVKATTYTNSTGKPIMVIITCTSSGAPSPYTLSGYINGSIIMQSTTGFDVDNLSWVVPNGATYKIELASTATSIIYWYELR